MAKLTYKAIYHDENVYRDGFKDPRTGHKLPKSFIGSMAYRSGMRIDETCWGKNGNWWEAVDPAEFDYDEKEIVQKREALAREWQDSRDDLESLQEALRKAERLENQMLVDQLTELIAEKSREEFNEDPEEY